MADTGWTRRDMLGSAALFAAVVGIPVAAVRMSEATETVSDRQRAMLRETAQILIPATATPGAADVGADLFVLLALEHGVDGTRAPAAGSAMPVTQRRNVRRDGSFDYLAWLERQLDSGAHRDFLKAPAAQRLAVVAAMDAAAYADAGPDAWESPWRKLKSLILTGYYTSQDGASRELRYELVPGRLDADIPYKPGTPAWSSDWTAVEFS